MMPKNKTATPYHSMYESVYSCMQYTDIVRPRECFPIIVEINNIHKGGIVVESVKFIFIVLHLETKDNNNC